MGADHQDSAEVKILVAGVIDRRVEVVGYRRAVVAGEVEELVLYSIEALDESRDLRWVALSRTLEEVALANKLLDCGTLVRVEELELGQEVAMRGLWRQEPTLPISLRIDWRRAAGEIARETLGVVERRPAETHAKELPAPLEEGGGESCSLKRRWFQGIDSVSLQIGPSYQKNERIDSS